MTLATVASKRSTRTTEPEVYWHAPTAWTGVLWDQRKASPIVTGSMSVLAGEVGAPMGAVRKAAAEVFAFVYGEGQTMELDTCGTAPRWAVEIGRALSESETFPKLEGIKGDPDLALITTAEILTKLAPELGKGRDADELEDAIRDATNDASRKASQIRAAIAGVLPGTERSPTLMGQKDTSRLALMEILASDPLILSILRMAGRLIQAVGRDTKRARGKGAVVDVELGSDLSRILPTELVKLADPDLELLFLNALINDSALQYAMEAVAPMGRGPIVMLLDRSGSMQGKRIRMACSVAIALTMIAHREHREVKVIPFDRVAGEPIVCGPTPGDLAAMVQQTLCIAAHGGTDFDHAIRAGLAAIGPADRSDLIILTDDRGGLSHYVRDELDARRASQGLRLWGMTIGGGSMGPLHDACDLVVNLDTEDPAAGAAAVIAGASR